MVTSAPLRVAFFGTPEFAVPTLAALIESRHEVVALVSQPDRPKGRGQKLQPTPTKQVALDAGIPVLQPAKIRDDAFLDAFRDLRVDLGVVAAYGKILPDALLAIPPMGMINVHASLLPAYRGAAPVHRAVIDGVAETGVTIMRVVRELDAGPMLARVTRPIATDETSVDVERGLARLGAGLLLEVIEQLAAGTAKEEPQDDSAATYARKDHARGRNARLGAAGGARSTTACAGCSPGRSSPPGWTATATCSTGPLTTRSPSPPRRARSSKPRAIGWSSPLRTAHCRFCSCSPKGGAY